MLQRYIDKEDIILDSVFDCGSKQNSDPLEALLHSLELLAQMMDDIPNGHPGCLVATLAYSDKLHNVDVRNLNKHAVVCWRKRFLIELENVSKFYQIQDDIALESVSDMISSTIEGGIVLSRAMNEPKILGDQIRTLRSYIKLLFKSNKG